MKHITQQRLRLALVIFADLLLVGAAWLGAYWMRFNLTVVPAPFAMHAWQLLPLVVSIQMSVSFYFGLHRGDWRYSSLLDLIRIIKSVLVATAIISASLFFLFKMNGVPRSVIPMYALQAIFFLGGMRFFYRIVKEQRGFLSNAKRVLIIGTSQAAEGLARDMLRDKQNNFHPVGFIDESRKKVGREIHQIPVLGIPREVPNIVKHRNVHLIIIAMSSASSAKIRRIVEYCQCAKVPFRILPTVSELADGKININRLREVSIEDLLGRDEVSLDRENIESELRGKTILITGGGGSIGSEICRQIAILQPNKLAIVENCELNLYSIEQELENKFPALNFSCHLADVQDSVAIEQIMQMTKPDVVYHAAAYKHVPILQGQARAAILNNVFGTKIVAEMAEKYAVKNFVLISTDKAVNPENVMGMTKRVAEIFCQNYNSVSTTRFTTVRFGNVLDSTGSVIPLFREQLKQGGPITVTHADVTRYFMTIPEASQLILQATTMGEGGEIFVLDMGEPIKIRDLAEQMIALSGQVVNEEVEIAYIGLRPGEKLHEELFHQNENLVSTTHSKILQARYRNVEWSTFLEQLQELKLKSADPQYVQMEKQLVQLMNEPKTLKAENKLQQQPEQVNIG